MLLEVEVVVSPPPSKPKPRSPPSGAAETMHKTGRRLTKYILGEEELDSLELAGSFSPTKFFRRQLRFISKKALTTCEPTSHQAEWSCQSLVKCLSEHNFCIFRGKIFLGTCQTFVREQETRFGSHSPPRSLTFSVKNEQFAPYLSDSHHEILQLTPL